MHFPAFDFDDKLLVSSASAQRLPNVVTTMRFKSVLKKKLGFRLKKDDSLPLPPPPMAPEGESSASGSSSGRGDKYGLHLLSWRQHTADTPAFGPDIVAVHGLNGDPFTTWTHSNESLWLRDFLPASLPTARVYTFGYSSEVAFTRSRASVDQFARMLLNALTLARTSQV
jgi:hypothetical protein